MSENTGNPATFTGTFNAFDVIRSGEANGFGLPDWVTSDVFNEMAIVYYKNFVFWTGSELALRLRGGKFINSYIQ